MSLGERYYQLSRLGRETFCAAVAPASLVRRTAVATGSSSMAVVAPEIHAEGSCDARVKQSSQNLWPQIILPLTKKLGTPFVDLVTVGRTCDNDVAISHRSISRFQAFFRRRHGYWYLCDAGSSNGTRVDGKELGPRTEAEVGSRAVLGFGAVEFIFHSADSLYDLLTSKHPGDSFAAAKHSAGKTCPP